MNNDVVLELEGAEVKVSNPDKLFFPRLGKTKLDVITIPKATTSQCEPSPVEGVLADRARNFERLPLVVYTAAHVCRLCH